MIYGVMSSLPFKHRIHQDGISSPISICSTLMGFITRLNHTMIGYSIGQNFVGTLTYANAGTRIVPINYA
jgi:hypothetical protein